MLIHIFKCNFIGADILVGSGCRIFIPGADSGSTLWMSAPSPTQKGRLQSAWVASEKIKFFRYYTPVILKSYTMSYTYSHFYMHFWVDSDLILIKFLYTSLQLEPNSAPASEVRFRLPAPAKKRSAPAPKHWFELDVFNSKILFPSSKPAL